jgi:hypothetical protein
MDTAPKKPLQKLASKDVTDTLAMAMEHADRMKNILIIYETVDGDEHGAGFMQNDELDLKSANYMCDIFKSYVLQNFRTDD